MREILFRAQSAETKEWVYGDLIHTPEGKHRIIGFVDTSFDGVFNYNDFNHLVLPATIGQYTGLKDKDGNKIFEGDIVRWDDMSDGQMWRVAVVEIKPDLVFRIIRIKCDFIQSAQEGDVFNFGDFIYKDTENHFEIIGNIHNNTELIK